MDTEYLKCNFEDRHDGVITKKRFRIGVRHLQVLYMLSCSLVFGLLRGSSGLAILAVCDETRNNDTYIQVHNWDRRTQGSIISSYFIGYALLVMLAELKLPMNGSKMVLTLMLFINGFLTAALPTIVNKGSWLDVRTANFILGMTQSCLAPAHHSLLSRWLPLNERAALSSIVYAGIQIGVILAFPLSSVLIQARLGWELVFYTQAMIALSMAIVWCLLTSDSPNQHQAICDNEKEYIRDALSQYKKKLLHIPWRSILGSSRLWSLWCAHAASNAVFVFCLTEVPAFLQAHTYTLRESAWLTSVPILTMVVVHTIAFPAVTWISSLGITSYVFGSTAFRKLINVLGATGVVSGLTVLAGLSEASPLTVVIVLMSTFASLGVQFCGFLENLKDLSENFPGTLFALSSQFASLIGAVIPYCAGIIVNDVTNLKQWKLVLMTLIVLYTFCNAFYLVFGSSDRQHWDGVVLRDRYGYHNGGMDSNNLELEEIKDASRSYLQHEPDMLVLK